MKNSIASYAGWLLLIAALGFYIYGIVHAIYLSWPYDAQHPRTTAIEFWPELATMLSTMQALLMTNLGVILGISITNRNSNFARAFLLSKSSSKGIQSPPPTPFEVKEIIQVVAVIIYILALIACLITWIHNDFKSSPQEIVSVVSESGKMFLGVVVAYVAALLSNQ